MKWTMHISLLPRNFDIATMNARNGCCYLSIGFWLFGIYFRNEDVRKEFVAIWETDCNDWKDGWWEKK